MAAKKKTNPNGANQHQPDPRQASFIAFYLDPESETFANGYQSAIRAGYSDEYAKKMVSMMPEWLSENVKDLMLLQTAEKNLKKGMTEEYFEGEGAERKINAPVFRTVMDVSKFIAERLGKERYSTRQEHTGKDGEDLTLFSDEQIKTIARRVLDGDK